MKNKISRFRTKKYLVFAPNHFVLYRSGTKLVTFSHQKCDVLVTLSHQNSLHGAKTLPFSFQIGTKEKISNSHQIFTFWHQVLQNKTFRFRTKKYLDFAPNHFLLYRSGTKMITFVSIWHQNGTVSTPKMLCISNAFAPQFTAWCKDVTIYFQNR